jgi:hypothetical protein
MKQNRWHDAYHWLALIADEFEAFDRDTLRKIILHGKPIRYDATAALIGRLGEVPTNFKHDRGHNKRPAAVSLPTKPDETATKARLIEYARDSREIHPEIVGVIQDCVFLRPLDETLLTSISQKGRPGTLIGIALRFIYGRETNMQQAIPLLDVWSKLWSDEDRSSSFRLLRGIWQIIRESSIIEDKKAGAVYLAALHQALNNGEVWKLAVAWEIFELRGSLADEEVPIIFTEIARHSSWLHESLITGLSEWLAGNLNKETRATVVAAAERAIVSLNESSWTKDSRDGDHPNVWAALFFPVVLWAHAEKPSDAAVPVFLRGLRWLFTQIPTGDSPRITVLGAFSRLDSLLAKASPELLAGAIQRGTESLEPSVAVFCRLIVAYSRRANLLPAMPKSAITVPAEPGSSAKRPTPIEKRGS